MPDIQNKVKEFSRLILLIIVLPVLATVVFSKFVTSESFFEPSYRFTIHRSLVEYLKINCTQSPCQHPGIDSKRIRISREPDSGRVAFLASASSHRELQLLRESQVSILNAQIQSKDCPADPGKFAAKLLIANFEFKETPAYFNKDLLDAVHLSNAIRADFSKEIVIGICRKLLKSVYIYYIPEVEPTHEHKISELKIVIIFYLVLTCLALFLFFLYPNYKNRID